MTDTAHPHDDRLGPVDYQIIHFPSGTVSGAGFRQLLALVDAHLIHVLDLEFITLGGDGQPTVVPAHDVAVDGDDPIDMTLFDGASSGLVSDLDLAEVAAALAPGGVTAVLVYEEMTMLPVLHAWEEAGATIAAGGPILTEDLLDALDAAESDPEAAPES